MGSKFRAGLILLTSLFALSAFAEESPLYWMRLTAHNRDDRTQIVNQGVSIEAIGEDNVIAFGHKTDVEKFRKQGILESFYTLSEDLLDFPSADSQYHTYAQLNQLLQKWQQENPDIVRVQSIGKTAQGRDIYTVIISTDLDHSSEKPAVLFMGGHHAREHLSVEIPIKLIQYILDKYRAGDAAIKNYVNTREIHIIPMTNPDGLEFDTEGGKYHMWRKNRRDNGDGTFGVDLNRNYGYHWGTGGSSRDTSSEIYMGPSAFSEPETVAVKNYIEAHTNISELLTFHTFSELVLYPWGYTTGSIAESKDQAVFETMAKTMANWNGYTPEHSSDLYIASGDTTDWAYGTHKIFAFTFEMDPTSMWDGGFYPGNSVIDPVFQKNLQPCLYLLEYADNPYRVLAGEKDQFGINLEWFK